MTSSAYSPPVTDGLLRKMAAEITADTWMYDDMVQEGRIEAWRVSARYPGKPNGYYMRAARRRMFAVGPRHRPMLGEPSQQGRQTDPIRLPHDSVEAIQEEGRARGE